MNSYTIHQYAGVGTEKKFRVANDSKLDVNYRVMDLYGLLKFVASRATIDARIILAGEDYRVVRGQQPDHFAPSNTERIKECLAELANALTVIGTVTDDKEGADAFDLREQVLKKYKALKNSGLV